MKLGKHDFIWAIQRLPENLKTVMKEEAWHNNIFVGGGYLRAIVAGEKINDIDVFVKSEKDAELLAYKLCYDKKDVHKTDNAFTIKGKMVIQIIHRWIFEKPEDVANSFDFTICCAVIYYQSYMPAKMNSMSEEPKLVKGWDSFCDDNFYIDLASKRLVYRTPIRNEDAGGSMLRVLKYYQKGYRIPLDSLGAVIARLIKSLRPDLDIQNETETSLILTGLLREVDPMIDPEHLSHLPSTLTEPED